MKARISKNNVKYLLRGEYGFTSVDQFFDYTEYHPKLRNTIMKRIVKEFTGYEMVNGKLSVLNPYTNKQESLNIGNLNHIETKEDLMKELSMLHKRKMAMMEQSRKRLVELSKDKMNSRDKDLEVQSKASRREQELGSIKDKKEQDKGLER